jgi:hypothetical protein
MTLIQKIREAVCDAKRNAFKRALREEEMNEEERVFVQKCKEQSLL